MALEITDSNFEEIVLKSDKPVMVDFWAAWCGPCRMVGPIIDEISKDYDGRAIVGKLDVDANQDYAAKFGVRNIPTVLLFDKGELVGRQVGVAPKKAYSDAIDAVL
ncbi:MAG: thioredoxin [Flavobacteriaceae bacterium]|nr:thioredoxin [Flavobacteriaceae bacterium]|tara:strand:+ start:31423 stop:31740 length:318 start_codon:yes stop_codon:yes gene_type:complete